MASTMKALIYDRSSMDWDKSIGFEMREVPKPELDPVNRIDDLDNVIIRVIYAGVCGSDRGIWYRKSFRDMIYDSLSSEGRDVRIIGHELLGEIVEVGTKAAREFGYRPGDIVSTESHIICGVCYQCRVGDNHVCAKNYIIGISYDGCFAEYIKLPARALWPTNIDKIRPEVAAVQEPFGNAVHACTKVNLRGKRVAIFGCGTIGLFAIMVARQLGAIEIIGIEPNPMHQAMAKALGADLVIDPGEIPEHHYHHQPGLTETIRSVTQGVGIDVAIEMTGLNHSINNAIFATRRGGDVILFGLRSGNAVIESIDKLIVDGVSMHSVIGRRLWETWYFTKSILESGNDTAEKIWKIILQEGKSMYDFHSFNPTTFQQAIDANPKVIFKIQS
ncbi:MAG: alcohol dehydrogenase catalytic domain-containing protein [Candidatus Delongbacteria bacterium]|nr:alcohol dehydrogenase catalytic domain-containing protein [Candidatus Delongbacteria bacterium]